MRKVKLFGLAVLALLLLAVVVQNTQVVTVRFLAWQVSMSLVILLALVTGLAGIAGYSAGRLNRGRLR